ncbi:MAG: C69 family dipeptidase [Lactobacillus sp.]|nr:C69 family dipeptidase [Lactobacillus sp.]
MQKHGRSACTSVLVGKEASINGSVMIARNEDCKTAWPKKLAFYKKNSQPDQFKSKDNDFFLELPDESYAFNATPEWTDKYGVFLEDGFNEKKVAMSATESAYANSRVLGLDPFDEEHGILEEAMVSVVLPYVKTAKEGVKRLGKIVTNHGAAEANGILFADPKEAWYMEIGSGHHYVAMRIPDDSYAVVANQLSIQEIEFKSKDFITSPGLAKFIEDNKLWPKGKKVNWREIFGTHDDQDLHYNTPRVWVGQKILNPSIEQNPQSFDLPFIRQAEKPISADDVQTILGNHYENTPYDLVSKSGKASFRPIGIATTQESHVLEVSDKNLVHWLAMGVASQSVYIPFFPQGATTPIMFERGTDKYDPESAYWIFKAAGVLVDRSWKKYQPLLRKTQTATKIELAKIRRHYEQLGANDDQALADRANSELAQTAIDKYRDLISELISAQTADSPLMYRVDPDL